MATLVARTGVSRRSRPGCRDPGAGASQPPLRSERGVSPVRAGSLRLPPLLRPGLSHRCPATILGWPQTRTRIAFGQSVAKPLSSGPRSPTGFPFAP